MHAASNGCYAVKNISIQNKLVSTNKMPVGLNRGYGGPQFYYGLERMMDLTARKLNIDTAEIRRKILYQRTNFHTMLQQVPFMIR